MDPAAGLVSHYCMPTWVFSDMHGIDENETIPHNAYHSNCSFCPLDAVVYGVTLRLYFPATGMDQTESWEGGYINLLHGTAVLLASTHLLVPWSMILVV